MRCPRAGTWSALSGRRLPGPGRQEDAVAKQKKTRKSFFLDSSAELPRERGWRRPASRSPLHLSTDRKASCGDPGRGPLTSAGALGSGTGGQRLWLVLSCLLTAGLSENNGSSMEKVEYGVCAPETLRRHSSVGLSVRLPTYLSAYLSSMYIYIYIYIYTYLSIYLLVCLSYVALQTRVNGPVFLCSFCLPENISR